ncbi:hypothetical protein AB3S75_010308 [Citrus x aurantiifolia]
MRINWFFNFFSSTNQSISSLRSPYH